MPPSLLQSPPQIINVGLPGFAQDLERRGVSVCHVDWSPPHVRDRRLRAVVVALAGHPVVEAANRETAARLLAGDPVLVDVRPAGDVLTGLGERTLLHAGPPVEWARMCGPMRGAIAGAAVLEGWAPDLAAAVRLAESGAIAFHPNHRFDTVGPMTGMTTRSMPVMIVENRAFGNRAYCAINEGLGKVMRFGGNDASVLDRLRWIAAELGPALGAALRASGGIPLKTIIARGLSMGDEMHQRNVACTSLLLRALAPWLARTVADRAKLVRILEFIAGNDQFFLNLAMALGKAVADSARGVEGSSVVTAMSRNGTDFGVRIAGTGDAWFTAPVEMPKGLYFPGFSEADANPDMGDSAIIETIGLGGFAMAASPAVAAFVGAGSAAAALGCTREMYEITVARNAAWTIPALDFAGVPTGIDVRRVVEGGIAPTINTGIAHRQPGIGQVGAGIVRAPLACFEQGLIALARKVGIE